MGSDIDELERLALLKEKGLLSEEEFDQQKKRLLNPENGPKVPKHTFDEGPYLWNPKVAISWSFIFTPIFGTIIHQLNWRTLGEKKLAAGALGWCVGTIFVGVASAYLAEMWSESEAVASAIYPLAMFAYLCLWYSYAGRRQVEYVEERFNGKYTKGSWIFPIGAATLVLLGITYRDDSSSRAGTTEGHRKCCECLSNRKYSTGLRAADNGIIMQRCLPQISADQCVETLSAGGDIVYLKECHNWCAMECRTLKPPSD